MAAILSVDGQDGVLVAQARGLRSIEDEGLPQYEPNRNGRHGANAQRAYPGAEGGNLTVELVESPVVQGGIRINVIASESHQQLAPTTEIPVGRDILFTARGGDGENGLDGGDGVDGMDGVDGVDATESSDATAGTAGGNGGDAGQGSDGADGGPGGTIRIYVHEAQTNLLLATSWDVKGGKGGMGGQHGRPGKGGKGGKGGNSHEWSATIGHVYNCTERCIGRNGTPEPNTLVRYNSKLNRNRNLMMARMTAQTVSGTNLAAMMAEVAARYNAVRHQVIDPGACHCHGGNGNCTGCDSTPVVKKFKRVSGQNGLDGTPGTKITTPILNGQNGPDGNVEIIVQKDDGTERQFSSVYNLELVDFDVEDENGDGIFEPGEHLYIRRIRVRNSGGMPSPARRIPLTVVASDWFIPLQGEEGIAYLPPSIPDDSLITVEDSIKVLIRERTESEMPPNNVQFKQTDSLVISATMPWLNRVIPNFEFSYNVTIEYPCELRNFNNLATVALGSRNKIKFDVFNKGSIAIGPDSRFPRPVEIDIAFNADYGSLESEEGEWLESVSKSLSNVPSKDVLSVEQQLAIKDDAECYQHVIAIVCLYIGSPSQRATTEEQVEIILVQRHEINMQVSDHFTYNPIANFLLVTNSSTNRLRADTVQRFIREDLKMEVDIWNVALYGGLQQYDPDTDTSSNILDKYYGKTILFFGNAFNFFGLGSRSITELCDFHALAAAVSNGTTCLFLDSSLALSSYDQLIKGSVFCSQEKLSEVSNNLLESRTFSDIDEMLTAVRQQKLHDSLGLIKFSLPIRTRKFSLGSQNPEAMAKKIAKCLKSRLPSDRCLVSVSNGELDRSSAIDLDGEKSVDVVSRNMTATSGQIIVSFGMPYHSSITVLEPTKFGSQERETRMLPNSEHIRSGLDHFEGYSLVNSLPIRKRCELLWKAARQTGNNEAARVCSLFAFEALSLSVICTVNHEVATFLHEAPWPDTILPSNPSKLPIEDIRALMAAHFPSIFTLLNLPDALHPRIPLSSAILQVLRYAMASARPQRKLHVVSKALLPMYQRRQRTFSLLKLAISQLLSTKSYQPSQITDFFASVSSVHSFRYAARRDTSKVVLRRIAELTKRSEHVVTRGKRDANDVVKGTMWLSASEWDRRVDMAKERAKRIGEDERAARKMLERMITRSGDVSGRVGGIQRPDGIRGEVHELDVDSESDRR